MFDNMQAEVQQTSNSTIASKIASLLLYYGLLISTNPGCICFVFRTGKILLGIPNVHRGSELAELHLSQVVMVQQLTSWHPEVVSSLQQRIIPRQPNKTCPSFGVSFGSLKMGWLEKKKVKFCHVPEGVLYQRRPCFWASDVPLSKDNELAVRAAATVSAATGLGQFAISGRLRVKETSTLDLFTSFSAQCLGNRLGLSKLYHFW